MFGNSNTAEGLSPRCRQHPWAAKLQSLLCHITHNHTHPTTACIFISWPSQRCFFRRNLSVLLGTQNRKPKWWGGFEGINDPQVTWLHLCFCCKVAAIQVSVNNRRRALGSPSYLQEISLPEDKAPTNYIEKIYAQIRAKLTATPEKPS